MLVLRTRAEVRAALAAAARPVGAVPTMGALHEGHRSLLRRARAESATVVATIFVNPRQFNEAADFSAYPRDEALDLAACEAEGVDVVWVPPVEEVYPPGFDTTVSVGRLAEPLEGAARPGHFDGVATVVAILFAVLGAERAYFGQKDAQQLLVVRRMAADLGLPTEVVACPTVREPDGLARASRNVLLSPEERAAAPIVHRALVVARAAWERGERSGEALRAAMHETLALERQARPDYVSVADAASLAELDVIDRPALLSLAVRFGDVRLIDNEPLPAPVSMPVIPDPPDGDA
jgi:pantoate--beta-alanine ligase